MMILSLAPFVANAQFKKPFIPRPQADDIITAGAHAEGFGSTPDTTAEVPVAPIPTPTPVNGINTF